MFKKPFFHVQAEPLRIRLEMKLVLVIFCLFINLNSCYSYGVGRIFEVVVKLNVVFDVIRLIY